MNKQNLLLLVLLLSTTATSLHCAYGYNLDQAMANMDLQEDPKLARVLELLNQAERAYQDFDQNPITEIKDLVLQGHNTRADNTKTALLIAITELNFSARISREDTAAIVESLLIWGEDPNLQDNNGNTPLSESARRAFYLELFTMLLRYEADPDRPMRLYNDKTIRTYILERAAIGVPPFQPLANSLLQYAPEQPAMNLD